nr:unnamed protein product [Callosobruchus chinensis]
MKTVIFSRKGLRFHKRRLESMSFFGVNDSYKLPRQECDDSTYDLIIRYYVQVTDSSKRLVIRTKLNMKSKLKPRTMQPAIHIPGSKPHTKFSVRPSEPTCTFSISSERSVCICTQETATGLP